MPVDHMLLSIQAKNLRDVRQFFGAPNPLAIVSMIYPDGRQEIIGHTEM